MKTANHGYGRVSDTVDPEGLLESIRGAERTLGELRDDLCRWLAGLVAPLLGKRGRRPWLQPDDALDALQDILRTLVGVVPRYDPAKGSPQAFFSAVAERKLSTWIQRRWKRWKRDTTGAEERLDSTPAREDGACREEEWEVLGEVMDRLPEADRTLLRLDLIGVSQQKIAWVLGCEHDCVRKRISRVRSRLRLLLLGRPLDEIPAHWKAVPA